MNQTFSRLSERPLIELGAVTRLSGNECSCRIIGDAQSLMAAIDLMLERCFEHVDITAGQAEHTQLIEAKPASTYAPSTLNKTETLPSRR